MFPVLIMTLQEPELEPFFKVIADIWIIPKLNVSGVDYDFVGTGTGVIFQSDRRHLDHSKAKR